MDEKERTEIVNELRSTYYEAAEDEARARGSDTVSADDVRAAKASISSPRETADSFMKSYAAHLKRAGFWSRLAAFIIDSAIMCTLLVAIVLPFLVTLLTGMPTDDAANEAWFYALSPLYVVEY